MSNNKQNVNKQNNFKINYCEVINELRKPVKCTNLNLLQVTNKKKQFCKNLSPVFGKYSKSIIDQAEIIQGKETSSNKVLDWMRNCRHPPLVMLNSNEKSRKENERKFMLEKFKRKKCIKTLRNEEPVSCEIRLDSSIGTFEPNMNSTPLSEHNAEKVKNNDKNLDYFRKQYRNTVNLVFERRLNKNQLENYSNLEFTKQKSKNAENSKDSLGIHSSALGITLNEIFHTNPHSTHIARLFSSPKNNCNPDANLTDNSLPECLYINNDKSFILNTETTLFEEPNHFSNCSILDFENLLKPVKPRKNNTSRSLFHDTFEQEFNDNVSSDIFSEEFQPFTGREVSKEFTLNDLPRLSKSPKDLIITPNIFSNNDMVENDVNSLLKSSQHLLNLLPEDTSSPYILKSKRRKQRKRSDSYFSCNDGDSHQDRDSWQSNITEISKSIPYKTTPKWNENLLDDTRQTNTSGLIQSINEDILESPHFPYSSRDLKKYY